MSEEIAAELAQACADGGESNLDRLGICRGELIFERKGPLCPVASASESVSCSSSAISRCGRFSEVSADRLAGLDFSYALGLVAEKPVQLVSNGN